MKKITMIVVVLVLLVALAIPITASATNPTVDLTVSATIVAITNSQATWSMGAVEINTVEYFSVNNAQDDDYSLVTNTGNVAEDVKIQGTTFEGGTYDWTLATAAGDKIYSLYANSGNGSATYDTEVKSAASYSFLVSDLAKTGTYKWSMKFTAPSAFDVADDGVSKTATVTLVASKH